MMFKTAVLSVALALTSTMAQAHPPLRAGYFPRESLNRLGSVLKTPDNILLLSSVESSGINTRHFFVWRQNNLFSVTASCQHFADTLLYAESHPSFAVRSGKAMPGQGMHQAIEFACQRG
jgi:hypothetical protein